MQGLHQKNVLLPLLVNKLCLIDVEIFEGIGGSPLRVIRQHNRKKNREEQHMRKSAGFDARTCFRAKLPAITTRAETDSSISQDFQVPTPPVPNKRPAVDIFPIPHSTMETPTPGNMGSIPKG